ncbi:D-inositol-3-phosphate glycosyltransferase [Synechococcus sp. CBW1107]|nr:D-inositol-3-phosphate glycosyltransferase [Synechococcus sp. CBW1107]
MKICLFVHCFFPEHFYGTEAYTFELARNLQKLNHDVVVVTSTFIGEASGGDLISRYTYEGIPVLRIDGNRFPQHRVRDTYLQPGLTSLFEKLLLEQQPDLVHITHLINHTASLLDVVNRLRIPAVFTLTDFFGICYTNKLEDAGGELCQGPDVMRTNCLACYLRARSMNGSSRILRSLAPACWRMAPFLNRLGSLSLLQKTPLGQLVADLRARPALLAKRYSYLQMVITPTRFLRNVYQRSGLSVPAQTSWFGIDIDRAPKPQRASPLPLRIGYIGQLASHKGVDLLVRAFKALRPCTAELNLWGPLDQNPIYARLLMRLADGASVRFAGTFPPRRMAAVLKEIDVLVIPSRWYENSPLVMLSALACHTPVVVSAVEGLTEFVVEGHNGFSFRRGDWRHLRDQLERFVVDSNLAPQLSRTTSYPRTTLDMTKDVIATYEHVITTSLDPFAQEQS